MNGYEASSEVVDIEGYEPQMKTQDETPGQLLARARQQQGMSVVHIADILKLTVVMIEALEQDGLAEQGVPRPFVRGYLLNYAKAVDVPEQQIQDALFAMMPDAGPPEEGALCSDKQREVKRGQSEAVKSPVILNGWMRGMVAVLILVVLVLSGVIAWQQQWLPIGWLGETAVVEPDARDDERFAAAFVSPEQSTPDDDP